MYQFYRVFVTCATISLMVRLSLVDISKTISFSSLINGTINVPGMPTIRCKSSVIINCSCAFVFSNFGGECRLLVGYSSQKFHSFLDGDAFGRALLFFTGIKCSLFVVELLSYLIPSVAALVTLCLIYMEMFIFLSILCCLYPHPPLYVPQKMYLLSMFCPFFKVSVQMCTYMIKYVLLIKCVKVL